MIPSALSIGGYGPEESSHGAGLDAFRRVVETGTSGDVTVPITWNIMKEGRRNTDLFDLVETGEMFMCYFSTSYLGDRVSALDVLETPFLFDDLGSAHAALDGPLGERLRRAVRTSTGFEALGFWDNGFRHMTNRLRPVHAPAEFKGMRVRMQPNKIHEELIRCWGAIPVAVELSHAIELITRLEVEAQENPLANTVAYGVDRVHRFVTMTGHLYGARGLFAHRPTFESLDSDFRTIVETAVTTAVQTQRTAAAEIETSLRVQMEIDGIEFVDLTADERAEFVEKSAPAIDMAHRNVPGDLYELVER
jgi:TRAP-type C4-dicarboxylate transport system substrate-binding protein